MRLDICRVCAEPFAWDGGKWCSDCGPGAEAAELERTRHHRLDQARMSKVRENARNNPKVVCWLCGYREPPKGYDGRWSAEHVQAGKVGGRLEAAHLGCNSARGNRTVEWFRQHLSTRKHQ